MVLEIWRSSFPELHLRGFEVRLLQRSLESGEDCSRGVLEPRWSNLLCRKRVSCDEIALQKILLLGEIQG
jgi:hypothetical protein